MIIEEDYKLDYSDVLLKPNQTKLKSRKDVIITQEMTFYHSNILWKGIPIMTANMATCGTFELARILSEYQIITIFHKYYTTQEFETFFQTFNNPNYIGYSLGIREKDIEQFKEMNHKGLLEKFFFICIDVPNGYIEVLLETINYVRAKCPNHIIIAGNVVSADITKKLILNGADIVKIGIGPATACTTRKMTGVGYPQLSAVVECENAAHGISNSNGKGRIIADGGQKTPGCVAKAFCAGADFNMFGSMFSGYEESGGNTIEKNGKLYKEYFGSSSNKAMQEFYGKKESYRASEGRYTLLPHKGSIHSFLQDLLGSLRSTGTYIDAKELKEFSQKARFVKVNRQQ